MKFLPLLFCLLSCCLASSCRTTTEYRPDGGKTVIREADPLAVRLAGQAIGGAIAIHAQK